MEYEELNKVCLAYIREHSKNLILGYPVWVPTGGAMWMPESVDAIWDIVADIVSPEYAAEHRKTHDINASWDAHNRMVTLIQIANKSREEVVSQLRALFLQGVTTEEMNMAINGLELEWLKDIQSKSFQEGSRYGSVITREIFSEKD